MNARRSRKVIIAAVIVVVVLIFGGYFVMRSVTKSRNTSGEIFLYGEIHAAEGILEDRKSVV